MSPLALVQRAKYVATLPWSAGANSLANSVLPVKARNSARLGSVTAVSATARKFAAEEGDPEPDPRLLAMVCERLGIEPSPEKAARRWGADGEGVAVEAGE
jgi:hypothetical protein